VGRRRGGRGGGGDWMAKQELKFLITFYITHVEKLLKTHLEAMCMFLCNITHVKNLQLVWKRVGKLSKM
jgi:hypothetical protein